MISVRNLLRVHPSGALPMWGVRARATNHVIYFSTRQQAVKVHRQTSESTLLQPPSHRTAKRVTRLAAPALAFTVLVAWIGTSATPLHVSLLLIATGIAAVTIAMDDTDYDGNGDGDAPTIEMPIVHTIANDETYGRHAIREGGLRPIPAPPVPGHKPQHLADDAGDDA